MKCPYSGYWNRIPVNKIFIEQPSSEPKVKVLIPMYEPLKVAKCEKSGKPKTQRKELIKRVINMSEDENNEHESDEGSLDRIIERKIDRKKKEEKSGF